MIPSIGLKCFEITKQMLNRFKRKHPIYSSQNTNNNYLIFHFNLIYQLFITYVKTDFNYCKLLVILQTKEKQLTITLKFPLGILGNISPNNITSIARLLEHYGCLLSMNFKKNGNIGVTTTGDFPTNTEEAQQAIHNLQGYTNYPFQLSYQKFKVPAQVLFKYYIFSIKNNLISPGRLGSVD